MTEQVHCQWPPRWQKWPFPAVPETGTPDLRRHVVNVVKQPFFFMVRAGWIYTCLKGTKSFGAITAANSTGIFAESAGRECEKAVRVHMYAGVLWLDGLSGEAGRVQRGMCLKTTLAELKWTLIIQSVSGLVLRMHLIRVLQFYCPFSLPLPLLVILHSIKVNVRQEEVWGESWLRQTRTHINSRN